MFGVYARSMEREWDWGEWTLGDIPGIFAQAVELFGGSSEIALARVTLPSLADPLPRVELWVTMRAESDRMRVEIIDGEFVSTFDPAPLVPDGSWSCQVAGLRLAVYVKEGS